METDIQKDKMSEAIDSRIADIVKVAHYLKRELTANERELQTTRFYDYRYMSPLEATELFAELYREKYQDNWGRNFSTKDAHKKLGGPKAGIFASSQEFVAMWRARQFFDQIGLPYDFALSHVFRAIMRSGYKRLPRPNQLYAITKNHIILESIANNWDEWQTYMTGAWSELPQFQNEHFKGYTDQIAHREHVINIIDKRETRNWNIGNFVYVKRLLDENKALELFGEETMERARVEIARTPQLPEVKIGGEHFLPGCFLMQGAFVEASDECSKCHVAQECKTHQATVSELVKAAYGSEDARKARDRENGRIRAQRKRDRDKAKKLSLAETELEISRKQ